MHSSTVVDRVTTPGSDMISSTCGIAGGLAREDHLPRVIALGQDSTKSVAVHHQHRADILSAISDSASKTDVPGAYGPDQPARFVSKTAPIVSLSRGIRTSKLPPILRPISVSFNT